MARKKTEIRTAAGKLTSAIQKEWGNELGELHASASEEVMNLSHGFLHAESAEDLRSLLGGKSIAEYLGVSWVADHPAVKCYIADLEFLL